MKIRPLLALFSAFLSIPAVQAASLDGKWGGRGLAIMNPDSPRQKMRACSEIGLEFQQFVVKLALRSGFYRCEDLKAEYEAVEFLLQDGKVILNGEAIGTITESKLEIRIVDAQDGVVFHLVLNQDSNALHYFEEWIEGERVRLRVVGDLAKS